MLTTTRRTTLRLLLGLPLLGLIHPARAAAADRLRVGWQKGSLLALLKGTGTLDTRLAAKGITVEWSEFNSGPPLLEALGAGALDFGYTGDVPPLFAHAARGNLLFVAATRGAEDASAILVRKDSPITKLEDLKGKRLAFKRGSSAHNFAVKALRKAGLTPADVTVLDLAPPDAAVAFAAGELDAWAIWDPYFAVAEADPQTRVLATTEGIVKSYGFYSANGTYTRDNPALIAEVIDELKLAGTWSQTHLDETVKAFADSTKLPEATVRKMVGRKGYDLSGTVPMQEEHIRYEQELADEFHSLGILPRKLDIRSAIWTPGQA